MKTSPPTLLGVAIAVFGSLFLGGCGDSHPATVEVTGKLILNGKPCHTTMVMFQPTDGRPASGRTDAEGRFALSTFGVDDGAIPADHIVVITPFFDNSPEMEDILSGKVIEGELRIPRQYQDAETSPLRATVKPGEPNEFLFELTP